jgi:hypothetical protein
MLKGKLMRTIFNIFKVLASLLFMITLFSCKNMTKTITDSEIPITAVVISKVVYDSTYYNHSLKIYSDLSDCDTYSLDYEGNKSVDWLKIVTVPEYTIRELRSLSNSFTTVPDIDIKRETRINFDTSIIFYGFDYTIYMVKIRKGKYQITTSSINVVYE